MKKNDYLIIVATLSYSYLFFEQNAGINFLIFNCLFIASLVIKDTNLLKQKFWLACATMCIVSSSSVFVHSSTLSIFANIVSLLLLSSASFNFKTSVLFSLLFSVYAVTTACVYIIIDTVERTQKTGIPNNNSNKGYKILSFLILLVLLILFFTIYQNANPLFAENTKWINFDFISIGWIMFTLLGFIIVYGLFYHRTIPIIENWENNLSSNNKITEIKNIHKYETERFTGILLFVALNFMLLVLNFGDVTSIWFNASLPKGISHSDFVHNGVGMVILSIIMATSLLMYLYRYDYRTLKYSNALKILIFIWIVQNLIMLFSTACRNEIYIHNFNYTYKRIGVYVWLLLAAIGLVIVFFKIKNEKSNWYLIKTNFFVWILVLIISSTINWDILITRYNTNNKPLKDVDFYYLFSLSNSNIPELIEITKNKNFSLLNNNLKNFTNYSERYYTESYVNLLNNKLTNYLTHYNNNWQSFDLIDNRIQTSLNLK